MDTLETISLQELNIFNIEIESNNRNTQLLTQLNTKNLPSYVKNDDEKLCAEFSNIFSLKTDKLTANNLHKS